MTGKESHRTAAGISPGTWPQKPARLDPGGGTRADRLRTLQAMREYWGRINDGRRASVAAELDVARRAQQTVNDFWDLHRQIVTRRWRERTGGRGQTMVADIAEIAAQFHPGNAVPSNQVLATEQARKYLWICPQALSHEPWLASPKDRIQKGSGCPECRHLLRLGDLPTLAGQYRGLESAMAVTHASHKTAPWACLIWAADPVTGVWRKVTHRFEAVIKGRTLQGDGCLVCAGYEIDDTNSLLTWFPEIAEEIGDPDLDLRKLPTSTHNVSRRDHGGSEGGGVYATIRWRCRHGHVWLSTILNRVQGSACPQCSTAGISKEQVRVAAELAGLLDLVPPDRPDPRLPDGIPDFGPLKIDVPAAHRPAAWRYGRLEIDACFCHPSCRVAVEYDGAFHHSSVRRDRVPFETAKDRLLIELGYLPLRLRLGDLPELGSPAIVLPLPERATPYEAAAAVIEALEARFPGTINGAASYLAGGTAQHQDLAESYIRAVWGEARPRRTRVRATTHGTAPRTRALKATDPYLGSLLTPAGDPYRNPKPGGATLRDYHCRCGLTLEFAVQSQVTSGNTRSCGCLAQNARGRSRTPIGRANTVAARQWAQERGLIVSNNGRVSANIVASYLLHSAGLTDHSDEHGLLDQAQVRAWAELKGIPLLSRGRLPEQAWLGYAAGHLQVAD
jgi:Probable Zinc-ribbon domain